MRVRRRRSGGRMQNYHVRPVRYTLSAGSVDSDGWGARIVGWGFLVFSVILLEEPFRETFGAVLQTLFGARDLSGLVDVAGRYWQGWLAGLVLVVVGTSILAGLKLGYFAAMGVSLILLPAVPIGTATGIIMIYVLWTGYRGAKWSPGIWSRIVPEPPPGLESSSPAIPDG